MKKYILIFILVFAAVLTIAYLGGVIHVNPQIRSGHNHAHEEHALEGHDHGHEGHDHGSAEGVRLTAEQLKHVDIKVSQAVSGKISRRLELHGEVKLNADRTAKIMQRVPGFVTKVCASQGDTVKRGQLLARLTSEKLGEHYSDYYSSKALEAVAKSEFAMAQKLYAGKSMSEKEFLRYKKDYIDAGISRRKAETILRSLELDPEHKNHVHDKGKDVICTEYDIVSPIDGTIVTKDIAIGEKYADDNTQVLFTVSDLDRLWLELKADYSELKEITPGMQVEVTPLNHSGRYSGKVIYVSRLVDEASRKGFVRVELDNQANKMRSGEFALGAVSIDSRRTGITVPRDSVQLVSGETVVFVPSKGSYVTRVISTGESDGKNIEIISGLAEGEQYVSTGAFQLKSILLTSGMDPHAGHGH